MIRTRRNRLLREQRPAVPEAHVVRIWLAAATPDRTFVTTKGDTVRILDAGELNRHDGPDFLHATIVMNGTLLKGHIEVHVHARDWERHGHQQDIHYTGVVLHVCMYADRGKAALPPTVALALQLGQPLRKAWSAARQPAATLRCVMRSGSVNCNLAEATLALAAAQRFARKRARVRQRLNELTSIMEYGPAFRQTVYEGFARGMGFGGNEEQFARLAQALPLSALSRCPPDERFRLLAGVESESSPQHWWNRSGVMPHNRYERRLRWFADWCRQLDDPRWWRRCFRVLRRWRMQSGDFLPLMSVGHPARHPGRERVHELVVNVLAPAVAEYAATGDNPDLASAATALYFHLPSPPQNRHTRSVARALQLSCTTAASQQGMIELYTEFCSRVRCRDCPLSQVEGNPLHSL